jgi:hypothetical protein
MAGRFTFGDIGRAHGDSRNAHALLSKWNSRVAKHVGGKVVNTADGPRVTVSIGGKDQAVLRRLKDGWSWAEVMRPGKMFGKGTRIAKFRVQNMDKMRPGQFASVAKQALQKGLKKYQNESEHPGVDALLNEVCERAGILSEGSE